MLSFLATLVGLYAAISLVGVVAVVLGLVLLFLVFLGVLDSAVGRAAALAGVVLLGAGSGYQFIEAQTINSERFRQLTGNLRAEAERALVAEAITADQGERARRAEQALSDTTRQLEKVLADVRSRPPVERDRTCIPRPNAKRLRDL